MREIKFRAWIKDHRDVLGRKIPDQMTDEFGVTAWDSDYFIPLGSYLEYMTLMQYTGLKDKNGKEIYEGDVLYSIDNIVVESIGGYGRTEQEAAFAVVTYDTDLAAFVLQSDNVMLKDELIWEHACYSEIIGNIYENPELIKT